MKVLTYFSFTLLSIFIQFSVMDYLQDDLVHKGVDVNITSSKTPLSNIIKDLGFMPHALYYHSPKNNDLNKNDVDKKIYRNTSLSDKQQSSTDATSTILDIFLYENTTITEDIFTTDSEYTSIGYDNVTEVTLFVNKNETSQSDKDPPTKYNFNCNCNLLYEVCDINCCCDFDCNNSLKKMFNCMDSEQTKSNQIGNVCLSHLLLSGKNYENILDNIFCIVKTNLPEHRNINKNDYVNTAADDQYLKWHQSENPKYFKDFSKMQYKIGDPVWLLQNTSINHMDLPSPTINKYCAGRKPITFFKDEVIDCIVKYRNLEMFRILKTAENSTIISATNVTANYTTALNCTNLHCTNWTIIVCDYSVQCVLYNKKNHEPLCNDHTCTNIALTVDYYFYYYNSKIANVSVILNIRNISTSSTFLSQRINVKFLLRNKTDEQVIELSGSPGYKRGLMLVVSFSEGNYTNNFYESKISKEKYLSLPINVNGQCVLPNSKHFIQFGLNKRIKCRYFYKNTLPYKDVNVCKYIQGNISEMFHLNDKIVISPLGNPYDLKDEDWIHMHLDSVDKEAVYGKVDTSLCCYNVISKISLTFAFSMVNNEENNTILSSKVTISTRNISFTALEEISTIVTTDINFVNISKRPILKYAGRPRLNINIPKDFFFSYPSNDSNRNNKYMFNSFLFSAILSSLVVICK